MGRFLALLAPTISMSMLLLGAPTVHAHSQAPEAPRQETRPLGGEFALVDTDGRAFKLSSLRGKIVLIYFGYTGCPDACPTDLLLFRDLLERLGSRKEAVQPIFISVDPARDTPKQLAAYANAFSPAIRALTGSERKLRQVAKAYGSYFNYVGRTPGSTSYTVDHSVNVYVVNGEGKLVGVIPFGTPLEEVVRRIEGMLDKPR
ncbi:MAG: electron transport protein SCO1/SenC [Rhodocyclaceae bacterium]|nr:MAG: electron transport protein SCO1/SenC [Rhodocyclaceae bacterium]TND01257.1 MAG: electron transport protein SCO1/SenC [Rhodocyclaceae bacterium]